MAFLTLGLDCAAGGGGERGGGRLEEEEVTDLEDLLWPSGDRLGGPPMALLLLWPSPPLSPPPLPPPLAPIKSLKPSVSPPPPPCLLLTVFVSIVFPHTFSTSLLVL